MVSVCNHIFKLQVCNFQVFLEIASSEVPVLIWSYAQTQKEKGCFTGLASIAMDKLI